jgi:O-antigen/teichoic acid export membrane protein
VKGRRQPGRGRKHRPTGRQTLAGKAGRALGVSFTNNAVAKLGTAGVGIVLARMLGPHAFGTYAVAYVVLRVLINLNDLGVTLAIVRWPGEPREITPTVTSVSLVTSVVLYTGCYFGAPAYASAMGAPAATSVVRVLTIVVVIDAVVATPAGLLQRHFRQDLRMIADQVNVWLGTGVTLLLAWFGTGAMSLALGRLAGCLAALVLFVAFSPEPLRLGFNRATAGPLLRFGLPLAGSGVIGFAVINADQLVAGRVLGVTALGFFVLACNLSNWPVTMFSQPVRSVAPSTFARLREDPAAMRSGFLTAAGLLGTVALPVCLMMSGSARPLVGFVYGPRWLPAAQPLIWLAALAGLQIFFELSYDFFVVLARSRVVFTMQLVWLLGLVPALVAGARWAGIWGLALAEACVAAGLTLPWYMRELRRVGIGPRALAVRMRLPAGGAVLAGLVAAAAARLAPNDLVALLASGVSVLAIVGGLAYHARSDLARLRQRSQPVPAAPPQHPGPADSTGPIQLARDHGASSSTLDTVPWDALPLYRATVRSLRWDPAAGSARDPGVATPRAQPPGPGPASGRRAQGSLGKQAECPRPVPQPARAPQHPAQK